MRPVRCLPSLITIEWTRTAGDGAGSDTDHREPKTECETLRTLFQPRSNKKDMTMVRNAEGSIPLQNSDGPRARLQRSDQVIAVMGSEGLRAAAEKQCANPTEVGAQCREEEPTADHTNTLSRKPKITMTRRADNARRSASNSHNNSRSEDTGEHTPLSSEKGKTQQPKRYVADPMKHCTFTPVINKKANARLLSRRRESSPEQGALEDFLVPRAVKGSAPLKGTDPNAGDRTVYPKGFEKAVQRLREGGTPNKENVLLSERGPQKKSTPTPTVPKPFHFHVEERRRARQDSSEMERRADAPMVNPYEGEEADDKDNDPVVLLVDVELPEYCAPPDGESNVVRMAVRKTNSANLLTFYFSKKYKLNREDSVLLHHRLISEMSAL